ncbi:alpha/beta hydrolase, partial [Nitritalea halalkaliphila LW7]
MSSRFARRIPATREGRPRLLFLHGFLEDHRIWEPACTVLAGEFELILVDLPGFGRSPMPQEEEGPLRIESVAVSLLDWLEEEGAAENLFLIGHSLGGYIALALAELLGAELQGLCLFHSTAFADSPEKQHMRDKVCTFLEKQGVAAFLRGFVPSLFAQGQRDLLQGRIQTLIAHGSQTPTAVALAYTKAMRARPDRREVLARMPHSLLIAGQEDPAISEEDSRAQESLVTRFVL